MVWILLLLHVGGVLGLIARSGSASRAGWSSLILAITPPAATTIWAVSRLAGDGDVDRMSFDWVSGLDLEIAVVVDPLSLLLATIVSGIGVMVGIYAAGYFGPNAAGLDRFAATMLAFSGSMLGLVLADSIWTLFVFWELTSITSYLLVGTKNEKGPVRDAARRALMITGAGGLALLAGVVLFVDGAGSAALRDLPMLDGASAELAAVLVLVAAATKSAQVPFHVWLPGAMAAPTPVSAYLHSATMVKAGVVVVAVLAPAFSETAAWTPVGVSFGLLSMVWGAVGALRQVDGKLILAWGTVSQLGLMIALLSLGDGKATFAAIAIVGAHAIFKAALFMVIGEVDVRCGTRRIDQLGGLWRTMPTATAVALVSGLSMAGAGPVVGFAAKEGAVEAALGLDGWEYGVMLAGVIGGSVLTVAYTTRFVIGVFGPARRSESGDGSIEAVPEPTPDPARPAIQISAVLGVLSIVAFIALSTFVTVTRDAAVVLDASAASSTLKQWPGFSNTAFQISIGIVAGGVVVGLAVLRWPLGREPRPLGAGFADEGIAGVLRVAKLVAARVQHGSLPLYLATAAFVAALAAIPFFTGQIDDVEWWDHGAQPILALLTVVGAAGTVFVSRRIGAALALGAVGFGIAGLFVLQGAPDLALTQLLVETVIVVGFVVGLKHLDRDFPAVGLVWRSTRIVVSLAIGAAVTVGLLVAGSDPEGQPPLSDFARESVLDGGGDNIVNVILTDMRALDTLGEIVVLVVVAIGVASLARAGRHDEDDPAPEESPQREEVDA
ncbi:MAG: hydrogen gas-evolving membrane-bound hydrogenase subunit E [Actinomycetota bacterium]